MTSLLIVQQVTFGLLQFECGYCLALQFQEIDYKNFKSPSKLHTHSDPIVRPFHQQCNRFVPKLNHHQITTQRVWPGVTKIKCGSCA